MATSSTVRRMRAASRAADKINGVTGAASEPPARGLAPPAAIHYPESDGKPVAETEVHLQCLFDVREALRAFFRPVADVYVGANMLLYYVEGNPRRSVAPDVFVVRGVPKHQRRT